MDEEKKDEQEDNLITIDELSRKFHVSTKTLRRLTRYGQLRPIRLVKMGPLRYTPEEVERFLNENTINRQGESQE